MRVGLDAKAVKINFSPHWSVFYRDISFTEPQGCKFDESRLEVIHNNGPVNSKAPNLLHLRYARPGICIFFDEIIANAPRGF
jgi:hypothetical protein